MVVGNIPAVPRDFADREAQEAVRFPWPRLADFAAFADLLLRWRFW
jgi:hypothetical protein